MTTMTFLRVPFSYAFTSLFLVLDHLIEEHMNTFLSAYTASFLPKKSDYGFCDLTVYLGLERNINIVRLKA